MTAEKLYGILTFLDNLDNTLGLQRHLEAVSTAINNLVGSPAQPQYQSSLAQALDNLAGAASKMSAAISPAQLGAIEAMGGSNFFDPAIAEKVRTSVQTNAMTPSVARDFVQTLVTTRSEFLSTVRSAANSLKGLGIKESPLNKGTADVAFLIPRELFDNELGTFAKELSFINRLVAHYSEAITGTAEQAELEQLSSSTPTIALLLSPLVIGGIGKGIHWFLEAWEKVEKIRKARAELLDLGLKGKAIAELDERITTTVNEVVEETTEFVISQYKGEQSRRHELENAVRQDTRRLFGQIERGLTVEFRANVENPNGDDGEIQKSLQDIQQLGAALQFPEISKQPLLLNGGEVIDGDIVAVKKAKTTKTTKTTTTMKKATVESVGQG